MKSEDNDVDLKNITLSPSSINTFISCPRKFWYVYKEKIKPELTAALIKGNIVHDIINIFSNQKFKFGKSYKTHIHKFFKDKIQEKIQPYGDKLTKDDIKDIENILNSFKNKFLERMKNIIDANIAHNATHAFHILKPKFTEYKIRDKILNIVGIIDYIDENIYTNKVTIVDYKTSKKYGYNLSDDYKRQLAIYAYLCKLENIDADNVGINFLRYGEIYFYPVTRDLIDYAIYEISTVRNFITENNDNKEKFFRKKSKLCDYCPAKEKCVMEERQENDDRKIRKRIIKNKRRTQTRNWFKKIWTK